MELDASLPRAMSRAMLNGKHGGVTVKIAGEFLDRIAAVLAAEESFVRDVEREISARPKSSPALRGLLNSLETNCDNLRKAISDLKKEA
jgi:hypothetical protein